MKREESLGYLVNHVARQMAQALHDEIAPLGVVPGQFAQLLALYERDGISQQELCEIVDIEQPTMANTLARMERDGLIDRVPHPTDGRKQLIMLTDHARRLEEHLVAAAQRVNRAASQGLSKAETESLIGNLVKLQSNLDADR